MKKLFYLLAISAIFVSFNSCTEEDNNTNECENVTCLNGGTCSNGICNCPSGFTGDSCQTATTGPCAGITCQNGGTCSNGICNCPPGFTGTFCQTATTGPCAGVTCLNGGTCVNGNCNCTTGFEGDSCQTRKTTKFVGYYTGTISCGTNTNLDVSDSTAIPNRLYFDGGPNDPVADYYGDLTGTTTFAIPNQQLKNTAANPIPSISGSGSISGNTITMTYTVSGATCNLTITK